jgi:hypothetical protein
MVLQRARRAVENSICEALERVVNRTELRADDLTALEGLLAEDHPNGLREALVGLRCRCIWGMSLARSLPGSAWYSPLDSDRR